jgi:hypothetical protein
VPICGSALPTWQLTALPPENLTMP